MNREIFTPDNRLEDPQITNEREEVYMQDLSSRDFGLQTPELQGFLEGIDFDLIRELFVEETERLGLSGDDINILGKDRIISPDRPSRENNSYDAFHNLITIGFGYESVISEARKKEVLIHEETHSVSKNICRGVRASFDEDGQVMIGAEHEPTFEESGYQKFDRENATLRFLGKRREYIFNLFNEGIVDKFAREITLKYLSRSKHSKKEINNYQKELKERACDNYIGGTYQIAVDVVDTVIKKIAEKSGNSQDLIWLVLKRGLLEGLSFDTEEANEFFLRELGADFLEELSDLSRQLCFRGESDKVRGFIKKHNPHYKKWI